MCLIPKKCIKIGKYHFPKIKIAREPIKVYKYLFEDNHAPCKADYIYHRGKNYPEFNPIGGLWRMKTGYVEGNWLHAYTSSQRSVLFHKQVEMTIPKGTFYIEGTCDEIAASCLEW